MFNGNYYNPYMFQTARGASGMASTGLGIKGLFKGFNFSDFLTSTGKTLNVINQAIPIFYQVKPIINNAKTMFKVAGAIRNSDRKAIQTNNINHSNSNNNSFDNNQRKQTSDLEFLNTSNNIHSYNNPTFFL